MIVRPTMLIATPLLMLSACGGYEDASDEAEAETVEVPANAALEGIDAMPVADPDANTDITAEPVSTPSPSAPPPAAEPSEDTVPEDAPEGEPEPETESDDTE